MWRPHTEAEIQTGIENGAAVESTIFDAKRELPPPGKNKDLAKDICAMTVEGGTLLYGVGEDGSTHPNRREPFATQGARERVDSVAQTGIQEPPLINVYEVDSEEQPGKGYLCVTVPPSPRAPHMLTVDKDNRYWGRGAAGNRLLTEGEVARLYERRERWEVDRAKLLMDTLDCYPFTFKPDQVGVVLVVARPVVPGRELLRAAAGKSDITNFLMHEATFAASSRDPFPGYGAPALSTISHVGPLQADVWLCTGSGDLSDEYQAHGEFASDGSLVYWQSPILQDHHGARIWIAEHALERAVRQPLGVAGWLYEQASFAGAVDVGIVVLGIAGCRGITTIDASGGRGRGYGAADYRRSERITAVELQTDLDGVTRRLLRPLVEVISRRGYDPLSEREDRGSQ
jgi:hypothetical protein